MKLYHGTNTDFCEILLSRCRPNKDFGHGFYLTDIRSQDEAMAVRRCEFEESGVPKRDCIYRVLITFTSI